MGKADEVTLKSKDPFLSLPTINEEASTEILITMTPLSYDPDIMVDAGEDAAHVGNTGAQVPCLTSTPINGPVLGFGPAGDEDLNKALELSREDLS